MLDFKEKRRMVREIEEQYFGFGYAAAGLNWY